MRSGVHSKCLLLAMSCLCLSSSGTRAPIYLVESGFARPFVLLNAPPMKPQKTSLKLRWRAAKEVGKWRPARGFGLGHDRRLNNTQGNLRKFASESWLLLVPKSKLKASSTQS